jgi:hypothetical protein
MIHLIPSATFVEIKSSKPKHFDATAVEQAFDKSNIE